MNLFIYGILQEERVIKQLIHRVPVMKVAHLKDHVLLNALEPNVISFCLLVCAVPQKDSYINGRVIEVSKKEMNILDKFEGSAYKRKLVTLYNETKAWIYLKA